MSMLWEDLKDRRVVRVGIRYLLISLGMLFVVSLVNGVMPLPDWTLRLVAGIAFFLLPFVLVLTWALENTGPPNLRKIARRS